jgi:hypothetical protein
MNESIPRAPRRCRELSPPLAPIAASMHYAGFSAVNFQLLLLNHGFDVLRHRASAAARKDMQLKASAFL